MNIVIPEPSLILLVGLSGSGKSTFARVHFQRHEVISSDYCRALVCDDPADQTATADAFELARLIADKRLQRSKLTVIDATNLKRMDRAAFTDLAFGHRKPLFAIVLNLDTELCWRRNSDRECPVPRKIVDTQAAWLTTSLSELHSEVEQLYELRTPEEVAAVTIIRTPSR